MFSVWSVNNFALYWFMIMVALIKRDRIVVPQIFLYSHQTSLKNMQAKEFL